MTPAELEKAGRECFERSSKGYRNAPKWEELHEDTRRQFYDWVLRGRYGATDKAGASES